MAEMNPQAITAAELADRVPDIVIITGMSGSGRTQAMHVFEDMGYFCIDNLPPSLVLQLAQLVGINTGVGRHLAVTCDLRSQGLFDELLDVIVSLEAHEMTCKVVYLEASDEVLMRRYNENRRRHPLAKPGESTADAIQRERVQLRKVRDRADMIIDTSRLRVSALRTRLRLAFSELTDQQLMDVQVFSFGFKHGMPVEADIMIDVRFLPNPFYDPEMRTMTGLDEKVSTFVLEHPKTKEFLTAWYQLLDAVMPGYVAEGKPQLSIAIGCTGGQHRSVAIAEATARYLERQQYHVSISHRDLARANTTDLGRNGCMSFTAEVRDELSRCEPTCEYCDLATLAALVRVCGTLSITGPGRYRLTVATETGAVARTMLGLTHKILKLRTEFTVRRSVLHKVRNYLITLPDQPGLDKALVLLGILDRRGGLVRGIPRHVVARPCCRLAYIRGALIAGGFVADPRGDFHLEIAVQGEEFADALAELIGQIGVNARVNRRKSTFAVYVKSARDIRALLEAVGAQRSVDVLEDARAMKSVKNEVNRKVNAELANQTRSAGAAQHQLELIAEVERRGLRGTLPRALEDFCALREAYPDLSLRDLGEVSDPPLSKSALYHRVLRLEKLLE